jgi:ABC-2 type transport system ATP-binding protein
MEEAEYCDTLSLIYRGRIIAEGSPGMLKTESMPEDVYELECGESLAAMGILKGAKGILEVSLFGKLLHLMVEKHVDFEEEVRTRLESHQIPLRRISKTTPSLEDVFVALVKEDDQRRLGLEVS